MTLTEALQALSGALPANPDDHGPIAVPSDAIRPVIAMGIGAKAAAIVRPGDTLILITNVRDGQSDAVLQTISDRLPGVKVLAIEGFDQALVYKPEDVVVAP